MREMELAKRKTIRLKGYDYSKKGAYFVTICTKDRKQFLSDITAPANPVGAHHDAPVERLTPYGQIADNLIKSLPSRFDTAINDYVIMPNHVHMIIVINESLEGRAIRESPLRGRSLLSQIVGYWKINASREMHRLGFQGEVWQRSFHEHVIRDRDDYDRIAKYIRENPMIWQFDRYYNA